MSRIINRKINRQPVRSPSPDIANKNIITSTLNPIDDPLIRGRLNNSFNLSQKNPLWNSQQIQQSLQISQDNYQMLLKKYQILQEQNAYLKKQLNSYNLEYKNRHATFQDSPRKSKEPEDIKLIHEYERRMAEMLNQIKRIHQKLLSVNQIKSQLQKENDQLRKKNAQNSDRFGRTAYQNPSLDKNQHRKVYENIQAKQHPEVDRQRLQFQRRIQALLNQLSNRTYRIQTAQHQIKSMIQNRHFISPTAQRQSKSPNQPSTVERSRTPDIKQFSGKYHNSYSSQRQGQDLNRKIQSEAAKINAYERQIQQLKRALQKDSSSKYQCQNCKRLERKIKDLQSTLIFKDQTIYNLQKQIQSYKEQLEKTNSAFRQYLTDYLCSLANVRSTLTNEQIDEYINRNEILSSDFQGLNQKLQYLQQQNNRMLNQLRDKQMQQQLEIIKLKNLNQIHQTTIRQKDQQIYELRNIINNLSNTKKSQKIVSTHYRRQSHTQNSKFRQYIHIAISQIQNLQQSISKTLE